jgi:hypothetical protein
MATTWEIPTAKQCQGIKGSLVDPQRAFACVQSSGLEGALEAWKIVVPFALGKLFSFC